MARASPLSTPELVLRVVGRAGLLALDLETTGLAPGADRIRLVSLCDGRRTVVLDVFEHPNALPALVEALKGKLLVAHNAAFDLSFLFHAGLHDLPETVDTMLLAQLLLAGEGYGFGSGYSLRECCLRWLTLTMPKDQQASDWSGPLSAEQLAYAAHDAEVLPPLLRRLEGEVRKAGLERVADLELRALPAFVRLRCAGVPFDRQRWESLARKAAGEVARLGGLLDAQGPPRHDPDLFGGTGQWNWSSPQQVALAFGRLGEPLAVGYKGHEITTTNDAALAFCRHPLAALLREHRTHAQLLKMYGENWLAKATLRGGRVYPDVRQVGTVTGRTSYKEPNLQQVPRAPGYHECFAAGPGRVLVKADYSQLQMRSVCKHARDKAMYDVFASGADVHTITAQRTLGRKDVTKVERQIAKSQGFCLLFGGSADALRLYVKVTYGLNLTEAEAKAHRDAWLRAYPGVARWHQAARNSSSKEFRSASGRRRLFHPHTPFTERLNTPAQMDEADGGKAAMVLLWERRAEHDDAVPVLFCHDEIVVECPADQAEAVKGWLVEAMEEGMRIFLDPVPVRVDAAIVGTWGG